MNDNFTIILLMIYEQILFWISYKKSNNDLITPANFTLLFFNIMTMFGYFGSAIWNVRLSTRSFLLIACGLTLMVIAQILSKKVRGAHSSKVEIEQNIRSSLYRIDIPKAKIAILELITIFFTMIFVKAILTSGQSVGSTGLDAISSVKNGDSSIDFLPKQGIKFVVAISFIDLYIFTNNVAAGFKKIDLIYLISTFCVCIYSFFNGVRTEVLRLLFAFMAYFSMVYKERNGWNSSAMAAMIKKIIPISIILVITFYAIRSIIKGDNVLNTDYGFFYYIVYYIGSPVVVFTIKDKTGFDHWRGDIFGANTFGQLIRVLNKLGIVKSDGNVPWDFVTLENNGIVANVATIFSPIISDFGYFGMLLFIFILYGLLSSFYYKKVYRRRYQKNTLNCITYAFLIWLPGMAFYSNTVTYYLSVYFIITYILIVILYHIYFRTKFVIGKRG